MHKNKSILFVSKQAVELFSDNKEIKTLSFYLKLVRFYRKNIIYDYTPEKLSKKTGLSIYQCRKQLSLLKKNNLIYKEGKHLRIKSISRFNSEFSLNKATILKINRNDDIKVIEDKLILSMFKDKIIDRQRYVIEVCDSLNKLEKIKLKKLRVSQSEYSKLHRFAINGLKKLKNSGTILNETAGRERDIVAGYRKIAKECKISIASVRKLLDNAVKFKLLSGFDEKIKELTGISADMINSIIKSSDSNVELCHIYTSGDKVYQHYGTKMYFTPSRLYSTVTVSREDC